MERFISIPGDEHDFRNKMDIYRRKGCNCSNEGISTRFDEVCVVDHSFAKNYPEKLKDNDIVIVIRDCSVNSNFDGYLTAYPAKDWVAGKWQMFGGCFVYTCNGATNPFSGVAIPLHDRIED